MNCNACLLRPETHALALALPLHPWQARTSLRTPAIAHWTATASLCCWAQHLTPRFRGSLTPSQTRWDGEQHRRLFLRMGSAAGGWLVVWQEMPFTAWQAMALRHQHSARRLRHILCCQACSSPLLLTASCHPSWDLPLQYGGQDAAFCFAFDEPLSHLIYAACDIILVPSMFEPCGLTQVRCGMAAILLSALL